MRFTEKYLEFARVCIPTKTITIRDRDKPWFNSGIKREMKIRDSLHKKNAQTAEYFWMIITVIHLT